MGNRQVWLDESHTSNWDSDPIARNPLRGEQVDLLLNLIADHYISGSTILDVGSGSGLVEEHLFSRLPGALVVGVDYSPVMMALADKRLAGKEFVAIRHDLRNIETALLPERNYRIAFSVQTIHNLPPDTHSGVMSWVYKVLSAAGFLLFSRQNRGARGRVVFLLSVSLEDAELGSLRVDRRGRIVPRASALSGK